MELSRYDMLSKLPNQIILKILKKLDLRMLCRISQVNKHFYNLTTNSTLYTYLDLQNNPLLKCEVFDYFKSRCTKLQKLDLSRSYFDNQAFIEFLNECGQCLTHLRLNECCVNSFVLLKITDICKKLEELSLRKCQQIKTEGFLHLEKLRDLKHLDLSNTQIDIRTLYKILKKNQGMRELHLKCFLTDTVVQRERLKIELKNVCQSLEVLNLKSALKLTLQGIETFTNCKNLRKIELKFVNQIGDDLYRLFSSWQYLEEIYLGGAMLTNHNLESLTQCKNLKKLYFCIMEIELPENCSVIFEQCPKLQQFNFKCCNISDHLTNQWKKMYSHITIEVSNSTCNNEE